MPDNEIVTLEMVRGLLPDSVSPVSDVEAIIALVELYRSPETPAWMLFAAYETGLIVHSTNRHQLSQAIIDKWDSSIADYYVQQQRTRSRWHART